MQRADPSRILSFALDAARSSRRRDIRGEAPCRSLGRLSAMPKVLVLFYSRTGNTARLADAIVEGARSVKFTEVDVRRIDDLAPAQVIESVAGWSESRAEL